MFSRSALMQISQIAAPHGGDDAIHFAGLTRGERERAAIRASLCRRRSSKIAKTVSDVWAYFDSSALAKRYLDEVGRREVLRLLRRYDVVTSAVVTVELRSALRRRVTEGTLDTERTPEILKRVAADREFWAVMDVTTNVLSATESLVGAHAVRALHAIHVASAQLFAKRIGVPDLTFVSADAGQTVAAAAVGMMIRHIES